MKIHRFRTLAVITALLILIPITASWATTREEAESAIAEAKVLREAAVKAGVTDSLAVHNPGVIRTQEIDEESLMRLFLCVTDHSDFDQGSLLARTEFHLPACGSVIIE